MEYIVKISASGLGGAVPADGFIDPKTIQNYYSESHMTGTTIGTLVANKSFKVNDVPIVLSGTTAASLATSINAKSTEHHFVASIADNKLTLKPLAGYSDLMPTITDITPGITTLIGFKTPINTNVAGLPATKEVSIAKSRGNWRWVMILESLQSTSNIDVYFKVNSNGATATAPTEIEFILNVPTDYHRMDSTLVFGEEAIKVAIAAALTSRGNKLELYYDPTEITNPRNETEKFTQSLVLERIEIGALTSSATTAYNAITVTAK